MSVKYRPYIDGLRAVAVVPVILFHADIPLFSGGYVGVDIFFVISGFLITGILLNEIKNHNFSIINFYERRIRRIFPALFLVLFVSTCIAFWAMFPDELDDYGKSLFAATFFYSNYHFMFGAGYFAAPSETQPLLHMWSLAVEEQFYIVFPIYLYLVHRYFRHQLLTFTIIVAFLSLIYSITLVHIFPSDAFYSTPSRAWELMIGSLLAILERRLHAEKWLANLISGVGLLAITYAVFFYSDTTPFPGFSALLPVIGSAMIIYAGGAKQNMVGWILSTWAFRFTGLLSYSLYLWHWPLIVFSGDPGEGVSPELHTAMLLGLTVLMSYLTWKYVETPFRKRHLLPQQRRIIVTGGGVMATSALFGATLAISDGLPQRFPDNVRQVLETMHDRPSIKNCSKVTISGNEELRICHIGSFSDGQPTFALWGDSHGKAIFPGVDDSAKEANLKGVFVGRVGCLPLLDVHQIRQGYESCTLIAKSFITYLSENPQIEKIILASRWAIYAEGERFKNEKGQTVFIRDSRTETPSLDENKKAFRRAFEKTVDKLTSMGRKIYIMEQVPETEYEVPGALAEKTLGTRNLEIRPRKKDYLDRQAYVTFVIDDLEKKYPLTRIKPQDEMCDEEFCIVDTEGVPVYRDTSHLTARYAKKIAGIFDPVFENNSLSNRSGRF